MRNRSMKSALASSLQTEEAAVKDRFEVAEETLEKGSLLSRKDEPAPEPALPVERVVRDSFTLPQSDYDLISLARERCLGQGVNVTKSEVIRAGLQVLRDLGDEELLRVVGGLVKVKTGRKPGAA